MVTAPSRLRGRSVCLSRSSWRFKLNTKYIPNAPSFSRTPARIIEPATGASTWALGSHWCRVYMGSLTKNAMIRKVEIFALTG